MGEFADIAGYLADQTFGALKDAAQMATKGDPEFIRSGVPQSAYGKIVQGAARQACRRYADNPSSVRPGARAKAEESCRPYLNDIAYGQPGSVKVPFRGGQCNALYRAIGQINFDRFFCPDGPSIPNEQPIGTEFILQGPISNVRIVQGENGQCGPRFLQVLCTTATTPDQVIYSTLDIPQRSLRNPRLVSLSFEIQPGFADNCGGPEPEVIDPVPPPTVGPRFERYNPDPSVDIDIGVQVNPDGTIDIDLGTGDINIDPWGEGGGLAPSPPTEGEEQEGQGSDTAGGENDFGDPPPGERWVGCEIVITTEPPGVGRVPQSIPRDVYYAIEGNARLKFSGSSGVRYDTPIPIKSKATFLWESVRGLNPTGVFVNLRPGFRYSVIPYSVPTEN